MTSSILGIIPARAGSQGIPHKNTALLAGRPLIAYTFEAALNCPQINHLVVTTDCPQVSKIAGDYDIEIIKRPAQLATDTTTSDEVVTHTLKTLEETGLVYDALVLLQPTSPLRTAGDITQAITLFNGQQDQGSVISVVRPSYHPMKSFLNKGNSIEPWIDTKTMGSPRQQLPDLVQCDGAIYITSTRQFMNSKSFYNNPQTPCFLPKQHTIDIDDSEDLRLAEYYLSIADRDQE